LRKALIQTHALELKDHGINAGNINIRLIAIRRLAAEAADNGTLDPVIVAGILRIKGMRAEGRHLGNWLTKIQTRELINSVSTSTLKGKRDKVILAVLLSCGLRREEAVGKRNAHRSGSLNRGSGIVPVRTRRRICPNARTRPGDRWIAGRKSVVIDPPD
jgi:site-specific recombinase XerD